MLYSCLSKLCSCTLAYAILYGQVWTFFLITLVLLVVMLLDLFAPKIEKIYLNIHCLLISYVLRCYYYYYLFISISLKYATVVAVGAMASNSTAPSSVIAFLLVFDMHHYNFQDYVFCMEEAERTKTKMMKKLP